METAEFLDPFERLLADLFPSTRLHQIAEGGDYQSQIAAIEETGFLDLLAGGVGGDEAPDFRIAVALFMAVGRGGAPLDIAEEMIARAHASDGEKSSARLVMLGAVMAGAAEHLLEMSVAYANERVQFGKPIGRQQAQQQNLAVMAEHCIAMRAAVQAAASGDDWPNALQGSFAKSVCSEFAPLVANCAHAVHGAIGISMEFDLQLYSRKLHALRGEAGSEGLHNRAIGRAVLASDKSAVDWMRGALFGEE